MLDDWPSFRHLLSNIERQYSGGETQFELVAVDDGSADQCDEAALPPVADNSCIDDVSVLRLALNLGHQRAIAVGLVALSKRNDLDGVIVMDSDGEDRPEDIAALIAASRQHTNDVILARRAERSEATAFKLGYLAYKLMFRMLTGRGISFGNFCLLPMPAVRRLVHMSELWNNLPAAIIRSRLAHRTIETRRGTRYAGQSKMNLPSLVVHGLSAMSVYTDLIFVRVLIAACGVCGVSVLAMIAVALIRLTTPLAIPGWASTVVGDLLIILIQALILVVATTLMLLSNRSARQLVPIADTLAFVAERRVLLRRQPARPMPTVA